MVSRVSLEILHFQIPGESFTPKKNKHTHTIKIVDMLKVLFTTINLPFMFVKVILPREEFLAQVTAEHLFASVRHNMPQQMLFSRK